jgi:hypothetical protein
VPSLFRHFPNAPQSPQCQNGYVILCNAHDAATSFLEAFQSVRVNRNARGMPTDEEQDLLRAMLLFASAGVDSLVKQLVRDALPAVLAHNAAAGEMFKTFVGRRLRSGDEINTKLLADILGDQKPRERLVSLQVEELCSSSLQSTEELLKAGAAFDIRSTEITDDPNRLTNIFRIRNQIAHEMDVDFTQANRSRRPRGRQPMVTNTNYLFGVANAFLEQVDRKLHEGQAQ